MRIFLQWFGLDTFTIQENSHFLYPLFSLCTPIFNDQVQLVVKSQKNKTINIIIERGGALSSSLMLLRTAADSGRFWIASSFSERLSAGLP
ncbi:hypothetical protein B1694_14385 [Geobacillus zalihae]|nr:hypothetical protein B1694_14385 [Geobacillus zalihae]